MIIRPIYSYFARPLSWEALSLAYSDIVSGQPSATGGTVSDVSVGGILYRFHKFTSSSTLVVVTPGIFECWLVGGGGGGAGQDQDYGVGGGGGGAGGVLQGKIYLPIGNAAVTVGAAGAGGAARYKGDCGGDSIIGPLHAIGGGGGSPCPYYCTTYEGGDALPGGSGGGCGYGTGYTGGAGHAPQGYKGGDSAALANYGAGGGGGAGAAGAAATAGYGGNGGVGVQCTFDGSSTWYAGGGGGGVGDSGGGGGTAGTGGTGGGGNGKKNGNGDAGTTNLGAGGGGAGSGSGNTGGAGGTGIVMVRYRI